MAFNRNTAKAKTLARVDQQRDIRIPDLSRWEPTPPLASLHCRHCGSRVTSTATRCPSCWRVL